MLLSQWHFPGDPAPRKMGKSANDFQKHIADGKDFCSVVLIRKVPV